MNRSMIQTMLSTISSMRPKHFCLASQLEYNLNEILLGRNTSKKFKDFSDRLGQHKEG
jgi:hypothetical protein